MFKTAAWGLESPVVCRHGTAAGADESGYLIGQPMAFFERITVQVGADEGGCEGVSGTDGIGDFNLRTGDGKDLVFGNHLAAVPAFGQDDQSETVGAENGQAGFFRSAFESQEIRHDDNLFIVDLQDVRDLQGFLDDFLVEEMLAEVDIIDLQAVFWHVCDECADGLAGHRIPLGQGAETDGAGLGCNRLHFRCVRYIVPGHSFDDRISRDTSLIQRNMDHAGRAVHLGQDGFEPLGSKDPLDILAYQYEIVVNGVELSSGAVRNHNPEIMVKAFNLVGLGEDEVKSKFPAMYNAFCYGAPPHAGAAPGVDRMIMLLTGEESIREVIPFPMNGKAQDVMVGAPSEVTEKQLKEVHIRIAEEDKTE